MMFNVIPTSNTSRTVLTWVFIFFGLFVVPACRTNTVAQLLSEPCNNINNGHPIADIDGETVMCLVMSTDLVFQTWLWSADGSTLAFALHDPTVTRPAGSGKFPNRPLTIHWYVMERSDNQATELSVAYNQGLSLSPDGKYVVVSRLCGADTTSCHDIYTTSNQRHICSYKKYTVWFGDSDCSELTLNNGEVWDIEYEVNKSGCEFYQSNGWDTPSCDGAEPTSLTPIPSLTPISLKEYPIAITLTPNASESYP